MGFTQIMSPHLHFELLGPLLHAAESQSQDTLQDLGAEPTCPPNPARPVSPAKPKTHNPARP